MFCGCSPIADAASAEPETRPFPRKALFSLGQSFADVSKRRFINVHDIAKTLFVTNRNRSESPGNIGLAAILNVEMRARPGRQDFGAGAQKQAGHIGETSCSRRSVIYPCFCCPSFQAPPHRQGRESGRPLGIATPERPSHPHRTNRPAAARRQKKTPGPGGLARRKSVSLVCLARTMRTTHNADLAGLFRARPEALVT